MTCAIVGANDYSPLRNGRNATPPRRRAVRYNVRPAPATALIGLLFLREPGGIPKPIPRRPFPLPSLTHTRPTRSPVSRRTTQSPRPTHFLRRDSPHTTFPRCFAAAPPSATDMQPLTRLIHRLIVSSSHRLIVLHRGSLLMRRGLLLFVNMLRTGVRQGLQRKWTARWRCRDNVHIVSTVAGTDMHNVSAGHCVKPDGTAAQDGMTCAIVGANDYSPLQNGRKATPPRRGAQIKKLMMREFYEN